MKLTRHDHYEAAFTRTADHDGATPEEAARQEVRGRRRRRIAIGLLAVVVVAAAAGWVGFRLRADTPAKQVERGIALGKTNSHVAAIIEFKRSLQEVPDQPAVRVLLGNELSLLGDAKGAQIEFEKAVAARYDLDRTLPLLATSLLHQGNFEKVIELVNGASIASTTANADLLALRGASYYALGREGEAEVSWKAAKDFVPGHPPTTIAEARALASQRKYAEAIALLDGIEPGASEVELATLRGDLAKATGKPLDAVADYEVALKIEPGNLLIRANLALMLVELSRFDEAALQISRVTGPMPRYAEGHFITALMWLGKHDYAKANEAITKAVQLAPGEGRYQLAAGTLALQLGERTAAEEYLSAAVTLLPRSIDARRLLATLYVDRHEAEKADQLFRPVFASARSDPAIATIAARIAIQQGDTRKAARAFDKVDPGNPRNVDATLLAASLKMRAGDKAAGFATLRAAAEASPDNPDIDSAIVMSHLTYKETNEALAAWKALAAKQPKTARSYNLLAAIELARGNKGAARQALQQAAEADPRYLAPVSGLAMLDIEDRKPDEGKARLHRFVAQNPSDVEATMLLVQVERSSGASRDAIVGILREAHKANPGSAKIVLALAVNSLEQGDRTEALAIAEQGLEATPDDAPLLQLVAEQSLAAGNTDKAIAVYRKLVNRNAASADYPTRLALALTQTGKYEEALTAFHVALARQPENVERQYVMVDAFLALNRPDEASRMLFDISRLAPMSPALGELDADVKLVMKQYPEAIAAYKRILARQPSTRLVIKTANALLTARLRSEADVVLTEWLKSHPSDEKVRLFNAKLAMRFGQFPRACADLRILVAAHPQDAGLLNDLAWSLGQINDPQALAIAEKANVLAPDNASINDTLGWMLVEQGDASRGLAMIEKANRAAPDELDIRLHLGRAQLKLGRTVAAHETLQGIATTAPRSEQGKASQALLATF